jgi:galactose-1-phosphate uridylyltransferase
LNVQFRAEKEYLTFHDPTQGGALTDRLTEVRFDPLTGETSRIIYDSGAPFSPPDYSEAAQLTGGSKCPFCPENVLASTPAFPESLVPGGRITKGEAVAFPNLFPYAKHNAVVRMCDQHYVRLEQFTVRTVADSLLAASDYIARVLKTDSRAAHLSVNWNYLPPSGGSILHPHLHVLASEQQTRYGRLTAEAAQRFYSQHGKSYYLELLAEERKRGERWVGQKESLAWVHAYAPKGHLDFVGIFEDARSFGELGDRHWFALAESMIRFFAYFRQAGLASFNMAMQIPVEAEEAGRVHVRLVPRMTIGLLGTSDMNVFNYLHSEYLCLKVPEKIAPAAAEFFKEN